MSNQENIITDTRSILVNLLFDALTELFTNYEVTLTSNEQLIDLNEKGVELIALISLSESNFRASLTICISQDVLIASFPAPEESIVEGDLNDWLGELANQLAGRFKNKVVPYEHKLELGIPTVIQGNHLKIDGAKCSNSSNHQYTTEKGGVVELNFSTLIDDQFILSEPEDSIDNSEYLDEGEMLFF